MGSSSFLVLPFLLIMLSTGSFAQYACCLSFGEHCYVSCYDEGGHCSGNSCNCDYGWNGTYCDNWYCPQGCYNEGVCVGAATCTCPSGWTGSNCDVFYCSEACLNGGYCDGPNTCSCPTGWEGSSTCSLPSCDAIPPCQSGSTCSGPNTCSCNDPSSSDYATLSAWWEGVSCDSKPFHFHFRRKASVDFCVENSLVHFFSSCSHLHQFQSVLEWRSLLGDQRGYHL